MLRKLNLFVLALTLLAAALFGLPQVSRAESDFCASYAISGSGGAGATNGNYGEVEAGDTFTFTFTLTAGSTFSARIVGDPGGTVTFAGPFTASGSYSYTFTTAGFTGIGFLIDATDGTVSVTSSCSGTSSGTGGPALPESANLVLITKTTAVLDAPGGNPVPNTTLFAGQTAFVTEVSADGKYGLVFVMGGWIKLSDTLDVAENYGQ